MLLERERELEAIRDLVESVRDGRGATLLFEAPAGLGKSSLLVAAEELAAARGVRVLRARALEIEREVAWGVVRALFAGVDPELFDGPAAAAGRLLRGDGRSADTSFAILHGLHLQRALQEPPGSPREVHAALGRAAAMLGRTDAADHMEAAIALMDDPDERAQLLCELGHALHHKGNLPAAADAFLRGLDQEGVNSDLALQLEAGLLTTSLLLPERAAEAHERLTDLMLTASTPIERMLASKVMMGRMVAGESSGQLVAIAREIWGGGRLLEEGGAESQALAHTAGALGVADEFAIDVFRGTDVLYVPAAGAPLVRALLDDDRPDEAEAVLQLIDAHIVAPGFFAAWRHDAAGRLYAYRGDDARSRDAFLESGEHASTILTRNPALWPWRSGAGAALARLGATDRAVALIEDELVLARRFGAPRAIGIALRELGVATGDAAYLGEAVEVLGTSGARVEYAEALLAAGELRHAIAVAQAAGAKRIARLAGERLRPAPRTDLTPAERRVTALAAAGRSNREIADTLAVSAKSVEWHLGNVYRKLGIRSRAELPR